MRERPIAEDERSGVLHPGNLARYRARWFAPDPAVTDVVEHYWFVEWNVGDERIRQRIVSAPAVTLTLEHGDVPAQRVITGVQARAWMRDITGSGRAFGIRLRPAGLAVLSDLTPDAIADATLPVTAQLDARLAALMEPLPVTGPPEAQAELADAAIAHALAQHPPGRTELLANDVVSHLTAHGPTPATDLAARFGTSSRTVQRALRDTLGQGPNRVGRWTRLQEVVRRLSAGEPASDVAAQLGYADQAHLVNDFRRAAGMTPGAYVRSLEHLADTSG